MNRIPFIVFVVAILAGVASGSDEGPTRYEPVPIVGSEFDSVSRGVDSSPDWIYEGSAEGGSMLVRPEADSEWFDGRVARLLPGDSFRHLVGGAFKAGDRLLVGVNAVEQGKAGAADVLGVTLRAGAGSSLESTRRMSTASEWRRRFSTFELPGGWPDSGPMFLVFHNHGTAPILLDKASIARILPDEEGFESIFNGRDLEGWTGNVKGYGVEDGSIRTYPDRDGGNLYTVDQYGDFVFRFAFKVPPGANNGIAIRAPLGGDAAYKGMEIQVLDNSHPKYAGLEDWQFHGSIYGIAPSLRGYQAPPGEWNLEEIRVSGRTIRVTLNGKVIASVDLDQALEGGALSGRDHPGAARTAGHLGFCGHGDVVHFKDLRVRDLSGTKTPTRR